MIEGAAHAPFLSHRDAFLGARSRRSSMTADPRLRCPIRATSIRARCGARSGARPRPTTRPQCCSARWRADAVAARRRQARAGGDPRRGLRHRRGERSRARGALSGRAHRRLDFALPMARAARASASRRSRSLLPAAARADRRRSRPRAARSSAPTSNALPFAGVSVRSRVEQPRAAVGERPAARVRRVAARASRSAALLHVHDVRAGHAEGAARGVRARRRPHARQPLRRHARHRRHAGRGRLRRSGDGHGDADADLPGPGGADARAEGARRDQRDARPRRAG